MVVRSARRFQANDKSNRIKRTGASRCGSLCVSYSCFVGEREREGGKGRVWGRERCEGGRGCMCAYIRQYHSNRGVTRGCLASLCTWHRLTQKIQDPVLNKFHSKSNVLRFITDDEWKKVHDDVHDDKFKPIQAPKPGRATRKRKREGEGGGPRSALGGQPPELTTEVVMNGKNFVFVFTMPPILCNYNFSRSPPVITVIFWCVVFTYV